MSGVISGCKVSPDSPEDMNLAVAVGQILAGSSLVNVTAGAVTVTAADANLPRFDLVTAQIDGTKRVLAGNPAQNPVPPSAGTDIVLAQVFVPANQASIGDHLLADRRKIVSGVSSVAGKVGVVTLVPADAGITVQAHPTDLTDNTTGAVTTTLKVVRTDTLAHAVADISDNLASISAMLNSLNDKLVTAGVLT